MCVYMCMNEWESDLLSLTYSSTRPCKKRRLYCTSFSSVEDIPELEQRLRLPVSVQDPAIPSATNRLIFVSRTQKEHTLSINWYDGIILRGSKMLTLLQRINEVLSYCHLLLEGLGFMEMMLQLWNHTRSNEAFFRNYPVIISAVKCKNLKAIYWFGWRACLCKEVTIAVGNSLCFLKTEDMQEKQTLNLPLFFALS